MSRHDRGDAEVSYSFIGCWDSMLSSADTAGEVDPEMRIAMLRKWALSLATPSTAPVQLEDLGLILPPLRAPKEHLVGGWLAQACTPEVPSAEKAELERAWPPKVSQLGHMALVPASGCLALDGPSKLSIATAAAKGAAMKGRSRLKIAWAKKSTSEERSQVKKMEEVTGTPHRRHRPTHIEGSAARSETVLRPSGRTPIRGSDPMAGSLFARDAELDPICRRSGIYNAQFVKHTGTVPVSQRVRRRQSNDRGNRTERTAHGFR